MLTLSLTLLSTEFEAGFKITFCVITILLVTFYFWSLSCGPYNKGPDDVTPLRSTPFQIWIAVLSVLLFFFDDPGFIIYTFSPTVASAGFTAFCTATFVASLLFFFLCIADNARIEGEAGLQWRFKLLQPRGVLYWAPKIIICSVLWATTLSLYALQRLAQVGGWSVRADRWRWSVGCVSTMQVVLLWAISLAFCSLHPPPTSA